MHLNKLQVDCVGISDDVLALFDSAYRLKIISNLRNVVRAQGDVLNNFSPMMQISQVEDFDRRLHGSVEDTKLSTNKQHSLSFRTSVPFYSGPQRRGPW